MNSCENQSGFPNEEEILKTTIQTTNDDKEMDDFLLDRQMETEKLPIQNKRLSKEIVSEFNFNSFEANFDNEVHQINNISKNESFEMNIQHSNLEDDDDFGDFNDFTQLSTNIEDASLNTAYFLKSPESIAIPSDVNLILESMFTKHLVQEVSQISTYCFELNSIAKKLNDVDIKLALDFTFQKSNAIQALVKALGIDARNIVRINI